ncbi:NAD(P)/FAD-dependent oxidoreductase [Salinarimonas soli]|uniref:Pyridine nucleotide-disulfide oxidoreductase n=1 Tax=Salinarimonas soli TaxID=1638099 RepID=A0A5B2VFM0_9HYPH|nr:FAD-dependent oxidoreductase [Salinarimonas soli]KAA2238363.1 pyridine nucleotide-disulfide oxidoreductase [Salinarimonas soli]
MNAPIVIVGAGQTAAQAAASLRQGGFDGGLVIVGDEPHPPYQRPPLSKKHLAGSFAGERLGLKAETFYTEARIDLRLGATARAIDPRERRLGLADGTRLAYSRLLLATGSRPRALALPGAGLGGVHRLRTRADVARFQGELRPGARLAIVGGGYIGLEVAATARELGLAVTVIEAADRLLSRVVSPVVSRFFHDLHLTHGVAIRTGAGVEALEGDERVTGVRLSTGETLGADMVLVATGGLPNAELAAEAGLAVEDGILVDEACRTSAPGIFAAGDVARFPSRRYGRRIRLESVQNAVDGAKAAAAAMLGESPLYDPVPWFWSDQYDAKLQIAGLSTGYTHAEVEGDPASGSFAVAYRDGGRLLAVDAVNWPRRHMEARRALAEEPPIAVAP